MNPRPSFSKAHLPEVASSAKASSSAASHSSSRSSLLSRAISSRAKKAGGLSVAAVMACALVACADAEEDTSPLSSAHEQGAADGSTESKESGPPVATALSDGNRTGDVTVADFYDDFSTVIVAAEDEGAQRTAATVAVEEAAPMIAVMAEFEMDLVDFFSSHDVENIITVGNPTAPAGHEWSEWSPKVEEHTANGTSESTGTTATTGADVPVDVVDSAQPIQEPAALPWAYDGPRIAGLLDHLEENGNLPGNSAKNATPIYVTEHTALASVASVLAAGNEVTVLDAPDIRATAESMDAALNGDIITLGAAFGDQDYVDRTVALAANGELPGGGGLVFPGRRMIALYGHPAGPALGVMGEMPPEEAIRHAHELVDQYQHLDEQPVIPAFEIIATIAAAQPGPHGLYTNYTDPAELQPYIDAAIEDGGYAFLDLQPGRESLLEQAKHYEELLKQPYVGLALDPEWKLGPNEVPLQQVGHVDAAEINEVSEWLAELVRENNLPQKGLMVHQFQHQMIRNREAVNTNYPELGFVLHADGHGPPAEKFATWDMVRNDLADGWYMAWKNFIDEDNPTFTPEETYQINPRPWFVSYQ
ncbi:cell wall-binding repeat-containing protein [Corynebacterium pseudodiphtheriticum]|uniref:cell wall-binding repeat-containing protein n=1 Tax=Corynebacterium pseudodiphtheriticum TaxID=37637 RepID=UPI0025425B0B|nr:cell wall-binding repeat-containing protein [Corynebacterium pseudodiphtheriticum]MDK4272870.1 cell wall-binding repeat-containing protein [Corynebacterium pseudodiphtheriticum]